MWDFARKQDEGEMGDVVCKEDGETQLSGLGLERFTPRSHAAYALVIRP